VSGEAQDLVYPAREPPFTTRLRRAVPSVQAAIFGAAGWAALVTASAWWGLAHWGAMPRVAVVLAIFACGAAFAFLPALLAARLLSDGKQATQRFAAAFLTLGLGTLGTTVLLFVMSYHLYFAVPHDPLFSFGWTVHVLVTTVSAAYQFAVLGLRLYFPLGFLGLLAASLWFASRRR
jgi:hypothetical protein